MSSMPNNERPIAETATGSHHNSSNPPNEVGVVQCLASDNIYFNEQLEASTSQVQELTTNNKHLAAINENLAAKIECLNERL